MAKYVIFVDDELLAAPVAGPASVFGNLALTAGTPDAILAQRQSRLESLAQAIAGNPTAEGVAASASGYAGLLDDGGPQPGPAEIPSDIQVLAGVGAMVVDSDQIDVASLSQVVGLEVVEDVPLYLPEPFAVASAPPPPDWHLRQVGLASGQPGGRGIIIGVLDTGIDAAHSEFAGKTVHFAEFDPVGRLISNVARDAGDHGTHVSSIAAGRIAGVAPDADIAVAAVLTQKDAFGRNFGGLIQIVNGFNWLIVTPFGGAAPGVDIVNASLGGAGFNTYLQSAVRKARGVGVGLIAAIGNNGQNGGGRHGSPGNYPEALGIGASDHADVVADFSDWGDAGPPHGPTYPLPAFCAPGVQVTAAKPHGGFQQMSGTSMATPVVAGIAARRMASQPSLRRRPADLFLDLQARLAPLQRNPLGNQGGAGRIVAH